MVLLCASAAGLPLEDVAQALLLAARQCPADHFVDLEASSGERQSRKGKCAYWADVLECPSGWAKDGSASWEWCSWGRHRYATPCAACSVERKVVPKATLTTCDKTEQPCWLGFAPNDLAKSVGSDVSARFGGIWYMDGNPYPEEAISFHGSSWTADKREARIDIAKAGNWAMHATGLGDLQNTLVHEFGAGLKFDIEERALHPHAGAADDGQLLATASITSRVDWAQAATNKLFTEWLGLELELRATADPDVIERKGTSPYAYTLRRVISPTGAKTAQFATWRADVLGEPRPGTGEPRALGPMPDLWLNEKVAPAECPGCEIEK